MSALFLRVDEADSASTTAQISKCLHCKESFITTFVCINRLGFKIPRDIRRRIAIECTTPTPSKTDCSVVEYYRFYSKHATTQKYNPHILAIGGINNSALTMLICLGTNTFCNHNFGHPFEKMLRELSIMILQTYHVGVPVCTFSEGVYTYEFTAPQYGDIIMGVVCDQLVRGSIFKRLGDVSLFDKFEPYDNNIRAFNIDNDLKRLEDDPKRLDELRVQNPPKIHRVRNGVWAPFWMYQTIIRLVTKIPINQIALVYGFLNPEYHDQLHKSMYVMIGNILRNDGNVY